MSTQKELLENLTQSIEEVKANQQEFKNNQEQFKHELQLHAVEQSAIREDLTNLTETVKNLDHRLMNPDDGIVVETKKNSWYRRNTDAKFSSDDEHFDSIDEQMLKHDKMIENLNNWKDTASKALWILFGTIAGLVIKMIAELL